MKQSTTRLDPFAPLRVHSPSTVGLEPSLLLSKSTTRNHMSMQSMWKLWRHLGRVRIVSFSSNSEKQTAQSGVRSGWVLKE
ncbi:hypothetical protein SLA2020_414080 [Shorea laevis]